ncbi:MAG TPA: L,D-transpeptidase family protein [Nitrospira sp.]|nr:L,D-transpeptidase family protein [Nitrospira sp.]
MIVRRNTIGLSPRWDSVLLLTVLLTGCVEAVPQDLVDAIDAIDHRLIALRAPEMAADDYTRFARQWVPLKVRVQSEEDLIRWPWESSDLEAELRRLQEEGGQTLARLNSQRELQRQVAEAMLARLAERLQSIRSSLDAIEGRLVLDQKAVQSDLLMKQARLFYEQRDYDRSIQAADQANRTLSAQAVVLRHELGRYADRERIARWHLIAQHTAEWSRAHRSTAIVVSKADRTLTLYKNGHRVLSYPVRLGFNGLREKQYQGDGATPEGRYRVIGKRGAGQTSFYRALVLDYPNSEDHRRFALAKRTGRIASSKGIGGQIEIHGVENEFMAQTLGCIMLDNHQMLALYERVESGTPVAIVGALTEGNSVALALEQLGHREEET